MKNNYYLAIDLGASGGRHILGHLENGKLITEEVYRFENSMQELDGTLTWDTEMLFRNILEGIRKCGEIGKVPVSLAIDTWGVDYVLLDSDNRELLPCVAYRDSRTNNAPSAVYACMSRRELYQKTGIPQNTYNTIFQLFCDQRSGKLSKAAHFLMMPEYFAYRLTGVMKNEYTIASTTGLVNAESMCWDHEILNALDIPENIFCDLSHPGTALGEFTPQIQASVGFNCRVILGTSHDTASAVVACPMDENSMFLSSGTWSLVGMELQKPITTEEAEAAGFTNEGCAGHRYRFLKNIMGMWLFQSVRKELNKAYTYDQMMEMAMESSFTQTVDPKDERFLAPKSMLSVVRECLQMPDLPLGDVLSCIYHSLANSYRETVLQIEKITGKSIHRICIVGGGSKDLYLNELTRRYTGKEIVLGPVEGTALGNLLVQIVSFDSSITLDSARKTLL